MLSRLSTPHLDDQFLHKRLPLAGRPAEHCIAGGFFGFTQKFLTGGVECSAERRSLQLPDLHGDIHRRLTLATQQLVRSITRARSARITTRPIPPTGSNRSWPRSQSLRRSGAGEVCPPRCAPIHRYRSFPACKEGGTMVSKHRVLISALSGVPIPSEELHQGSSTVGFEGQNTSDYEPSPNEYECRDLPRQPLLSLRTIALIELSRR